MKTVLKSIVVVTGVALLAVALHDVISLGMGVFASASDAPRQFWDALAETVTWGIEFKGIATLIFLGCFIALYIARKPSIKS